MQNIININSVQRINSGHGHGQRYGHGWGILNGWGCFLRDGGHTISHSGRVVQISGKFIIYQRFNIICSGHTISGGRFILNVCGCFLGILRDGGHTISGRGCFFILNGWGCFFIHGGRFHVCRFFILGHVVIYVYFFIMF